MATVKAQVLETLIGTTESPELSKQMRSDFMKYAVKDADSDEWFLVRMSSSTPLRRPQRTM